MAVPMLPQDDVEDNDFDTVMLSLYYIPNACDSLT
ncbi:hypothetical protein SAMN05421770_106262 [Granulicella rosea]|uniref:Uncharacterized protein n=1 Tax=Granulicella rosea TaxID=474952 RepID=A0A239LAJ2_9BACT|nr:hypothetical protein SAMN05421770_106262 [Granulicella rosea]